MKKAMIGLLIGVITILIASSLMLPVMSLEFIDISILVTLFAVAVIASSFLVKEYEKIKRVFRIAGVGILLLAVGHLIIGGVASSAIFRADDKQQMLDVEEVVFDETVPNLDMENLIIWDESDAIRFSEKLITEKDPSLGSMYSISSDYGTLSVINGKPHWLFPLEHTGFFKYLSNGTIPGYIKVNATTGDSEFIEKEFSISPSAYFGNDLGRRIYSKYKNVGVTDFSFEEDAEGNPQWVVTAYKHKTGFSTTEIIGVIIVDPRSGDTDFHVKGEQPEWVDRVSSMNIFDEHLHAWGKYVNGWWNPSDSGKLKNTDGIGYVFKDGNVYFYTGITSYGGDEATTGFLIYNPRTCKSEYNRISGSTESKAIGLMEELVQNAGYSAKYPYLVNINGEATYLSTLKGNSGNVVGYALASVKNYRAVAWGKTLREAQTEYSRVLIREGSDSNALSEQFESLEKVSGTVSRAGVLKEGYFLVKIENVDMLYIVSSDQFPLVALTQTGDMVRISYLQTENATKIDAIEFENDSIK